MDPKTASDRTSAHEVAQAPTGELKTPARTGVPVAGSEESFQANILIVNDGTEVAKVYERIHLFDLVDLRDDTQRDSLMNREVACLNALSPAMNARIETVMIGDGRLEKAIVMKRHEANEFLFRRMDRGEALSPAQLEKLAETIANFHFNPVSCPVQSECLTDFFTRLLATEKALLSDRIADKPELQSKVKRWFTTMERFIAHNADGFDVIGDYLSEPILGHGDLKSLNMVFGEKGDVHVLDVAPLALWQINTRRMDAMFFTAEMRLVGRDAEAKVFFDRYDHEYRRHQADAGKGYEPYDIVGRAVEKLDSVAEFYRYIIFFRLTFLGVNPERAPGCTELLENVVDRAAKSLYL
jgi:aminoglycoside phosphotransferase family enzyme